MSVLSKDRVLPKKPIFILCYRNPIAVLQHQLNYWFSKYPDGFYKFVEPCKHALYKEGDSWTEEIGYSRPVFNKAFDTIGIRYKSKSEFMNAEDKFQGKLYASYHDRKTNKTFFIRNTTITQPKELAVNTTTAPSTLPAVSTTSKKIESDQSHKNIDQEKRGYSILNNRSRNETNNRSYGGIIGGKNILPETTSTSSLSHNPLSLGNKQKIAEEMKNIWIEEIGSLDVSFLSNTLITNLNKSFKVTFEASFDLWRTYCRQIASSMFLMGEKRGTNFKAKLSWAVKHESFERIQAGDFNLGDREVVLSKDQQQKEAERVIQETRQKFLELPRHPLWIKACLLLIERVGGNAAKYLQELDLTYLGNNDSNEHIAELKASSRFYKDYLQRKYQKEIQRALEEINGTKIDYLNFTV